MDIYSIIKQVLVFLFIKNPLYMHEKHDLSHSDFEKVLESVCKQEEVIAIAKQISENNYKYPISLDLKTRETLFNTINLHCQHYTNQLLD